MKNILLIVSFISFLNSADLTKSGDFVVDKTNNKMWQDTQENINLLFSQDNAVKYCNKLSLGGFSDWHLPSVDEIKTVIDKTRKDEHMIDKVFGYSLPDDYWTKDTTWRNFGKYGYYVFFKSGAVYYQNKTYPKYVRCVRDIK